MFVDDELLFSDVQSLIHATGSVFSTNAIDLGVLRDVGKGRPMYVVVVVDTAIDSTSDGATLAIQLIEEDTVETDGTITLATDSPVLLSTEVFLEAVLTKGRTPIIIPIPPGIALRYIGLGYVIDGEAITAGEVTAFVALEAQTNIQ
ncbi:hypothetical protein ES703_58984 [subsurface metagenome]